MVNMHIAMELGEIRAFVTVVETSSINAAATRLHLTQPAVSRQVQRLEASLGVKLLDRRTKPVSLTPAGEAVLEHARRVMGAIDDLREVVADAEGPHGELKIGVSQALSDIALAKPIEYLRKAFPRILLSITTGWSHELIEDVGNAKLDVAFVLLPDDHQPPTGLTGTVIGKEPLVTVAPRRSNLPPIADLRKLAESSWVLNPKGCVFRAALQRAFQSVNADLRVAVEVYGADIQLSLVARGNGLGLVPARVLSRSRLRPKLREIRIRGQELRMGVWMVHARLPDRLQPVLKMLEEVLATTYAGSTPK